jgi:hypothetical protein
MTEIWSNVLEQTVKLIEANKPTLSLEDYAKHGMSTHRMQLMLGIQYNRLLMLMG